MASRITSSPTDLIEPGWSSLSGQVLEGGFELQELVEADEARARFKVRVLGDREMECVALFFQGSGEEADQQIERWQLIRQLRHRNISAPLGAGKVHRDEIAAIYAVVRRADESLDGVLSERSLTREEASEVLVSTAKALEALHLNELVHGCLSPSRVLAVGEAIKLSSDCVRGVNLAPPIRVSATPYLAPESVEQNLTAAADVWCLGATLFETLTQKVWTEESREETGALPEPFSSIALRCLHADPEGRATLGEVMALHSGELKPLPRVKKISPDVAPALIVPVSVLEAKVEAPEVSIAAETPVEPVFEPMSPAVFSPASEVMPDAGALVAAATSEAVVDSRTATEYSAVSEIETIEGSRSPLLSHRSFDEAIGEHPSRRRTSADDVDEPSMNLWLFAGVALLIVLGLIWILRPKPNPAAVAHGPAVGKPPVAVKAPVVSAPAKKADANNNNAWETRTLQPDGSAQKVAPNGKSADDGPAVWRVVAFTYLHRQDAEKKVLTLNGKNRNLHAEVFSPSGSGSPFLVVVGGRMTREDAGQQRRHGISAGLPRDSYIQNYNH